ncbi:MAG: hypothetical protein ACOWWM_15100 [Desulfobacterales bacterium]
MKRYFLITIDTEGDHLWSRPREITTRNSRYLPRFQRLCEDFGFKPTYLVNYEMAQCRDFQTMATDALARNTAEIGMHLHAWNSPPAYDLTGDDHRYQPFLIEYPDEIMREKIGYMTRLLQETFGRETATHRAGRWALDDRYVRCLEDYDYRIDCSVTPFVSWKRTMGDPAGNGGSDYTHCPDTPHYLGCPDPASDPEGRILEIPMTILPTPGFHLLKPIRNSRLHAPAMRLMNRLHPTLLWLRPNGKNLNRMKWLVRKAVGQGRGYIMFMLHSSELMPGGSYLFDTPEKIEKLYSDMREIFAVISADFEGATLSEYRNAWEKGR